MCDGSILQDASTGAVESRDSITDENSLEFKLERAMLYTYIEKDHFVPVRVRLN